MKVAVTGASGHIGGNLVRALLEEKRDVRAIVREDTRALDGLNVEFAKADVREKESLLKAFSGCETVYHLAAQITIVGDKSGIVNEVNVKGTSNVVSACIECGVKRLVHFSSVHALSQIPFEEPIDETRPLAISGLALAYDRAKALSEIEVLKGVENGLDAVIVNPAGVIGPNDYKLSLMGEVLLNLYKRKFPAVIAGGFDFVDVRDVAKGAIAAEKKGRKGERYLLTGHFISISELAKLVEEATGSKSPRFCAPMWLARFGAPFSQLYCGIFGKRPLYTSDSLRILRGNGRFIREKAAQELGYNPRPIKETVKDTFDWFKAAGII